MITQKQLDAIVFNIDVSIGSSIKYGEITYYVSDPVLFYTTIDEFDMIDIEETDSLYPSYLDVKIHIGSILSDIRDKPITTKNTTITVLNQDVNTLEFVNEKFGSYDAIGEFYLMNNVNTDFELLTSKQVIIPDYGI